MASASHDGQPPPRRGAAGPGGCAAAAALARQVLQVRVGRRRLDADGATVLLSDGYRAGASLSRPATTATSPPLTAAEIAAIAPVSPAVPAAAGDGAGRRS